MATFEALRHHWYPLLHPYRTHVLCPPNLCPNVDFPENSEGFLRALAMDTSVAARQRRWVRQAPKTGATREAEVGYFMRTQV